MESEDRNRGEMREFRLEGVGLMLVGGLLIVLLVASFYLGRWYERQTGSPMAADRAMAGQENPLGNVVGSEPPADVDEKSDFFDQAEGSRTKPEPSREIERAEQPKPQAAEEQPASEGSFYVQVVAGRDRASIEKLMAELERKGYRARLFSEREGAGSLFKVRVGGFAERSEADAAADKLRRDGYSGAWVTTVD